MKPGVTHAGFARDKLLKQAWYKPSDILRNESKQ